MTVMHEMAVTESVLDIVTRHAHQAKALRVVRVHLVVGELASIVDDSVQFYFGFLSQGSIAEGAELVFRRIPVELECGACGNRWQPVTADWACSQCGASRARIVSGREFYVDSIEVE